MGINKIFGSRVGLAITASGSLTQLNGGVYDTKDQYYSKQRGGWISPNGHVATGGMISDYTSPTGDIYRAHAFVTPGTFEITTLSGANPAHIEYLVIDGGASGGSGHPGTGAGGGGGAGGYRTNVPGDPKAAPATNFPAIVGTYPITVGVGGTSGHQYSNGMDGFPSILTHPTSPSTITSAGGGGGSPGTGEAG